MFGLRFPVLGLTLAVSICAAIFTGRPNTEHPTPNTVTIAAVGDIMLDRGTGRQMARNSRDYPFKESRTMLRAADFAIGNLECVLSNRKFTVNQQFLFHASPALATNLRSAGFAILNVANNHSMDCGSAGLRDTMEALEASGIHYSGLENRQGRQPAEIMQKDDIRVAFLGYCDFKPKGSIPYPSIAYASKEAIWRDISDARKRAEVIVVSFHWGEEYSDKPTARQAELARLAVDCGADLVIGHHPHVLQKTAILTARGRKSLVAYSLGGFIWDGHGPREKKSAILSCLFDRAGLLAADWIPMQIKSCAPAPSANPVERLYHR